MNQEDKEELIEMIEYFFGLPRPIINAYCERDASIARELIRLYAHAQGMSTESLLAASRITKNASAFMFFLAETMQGIAAKSEAANDEA